MTDNKWNGQNPWMGLAPYMEGTTLYGRGEESVVLSEIIKNNIASIVFGKSGIGKSSLLSAGISPLLRNENYIPIRIRLVHNTDISYVEQIKKAIKEFITCCDQLQTSLPEFGLWDFFHRYVFYSENGDECIPVIILDQFEEIYTLTDSEHKNCILEFFSELSSLLYDIKPDAVTDYERVMDEASKVDKKEESGKKSLVLKRTRGQSIRFLAGNNFRLVVCLREDKLYLLERNSVNIPSFKTNRYHLKALSPENAIEVIMCPRPELFSNEEAIAIVDKIADIGEEGMRTVDPAILSLLLYKYFEKKGETSYDNIFADYYKESTKEIKTKSIAFLENHLLTLGGYRNQIPLDDAINSGVSHSEIKKLLDKVILRTEKRKDVDYIEFSHDRLCEEAKKSRDERNIAIQKNAARKKMIIGGGVILLLSLAVLLFASKNRELNRAKKELNQKVELVTRQKVSLDSIIFEKNNVNNQLESEITVSLIKSDSLRCLIKKIGLINRQLLVANDSMSKLIADNQKKDEEIRTMKENIGLKSNVGITTDYSSLHEIMIKSAQNEAISRNMSRSDNDVWSVKDLMQRFYAITYMISNGFDFPSKAVNELQGKYNNFSTLRTTLDDSYSYNGHMIFDYAFLSDLGKIGKTLYQQSDTYLRNIKNKEQVQPSSILVKTCYVKRNSTGTYKFASRGEQELAIVAEYGGLVSVRVHVTNIKGYDTWYGDNTDNSNGEAFKYISFVSPDQTRCSVTLEVTNCTNKDITIAVISN